MDSQVSEFGQNEMVNWVFRYLYYLVILLFLFFMYGFSDVGAGTYIYTEF